jgi:polysaccharide deacetylase 2 family uncharacterized protein YibQ/uncharacterized membrane protein YciS (DUF1049 family)
MKKRRKKSNKLKYTIYALLLIIFSLSFFIAGIFVGQNHVKESVKQKKNIISNLEKKINKLSEELNKKSHNKDVSSEIEDYQIANKIVKNETIIPPAITYTKPKKTPLNTKKTKPKLVIILDDVSFNYQVKAIKSIPFTITPSFFPPTKTHPNTPIYAKEFKDYMVHVPMQALHFSRPEPNTMNIDWSYYQIKNRIDEIKTIFPNVKFINNHTGSKFTANLQSMKYLFKALKEDNLGFVDSRTTPLTKAKIVQNLYHIPFFERNIFLDNKNSVKYIQNQLKKAVLMAKEKGYAIAIGHPHYSTIKALKQSKNILKDVDVISINELYKEKNE